MYRKFALLIIVALLFCFQNSEGQTRTTKSEKTKTSKDGNWIPLFNGKNLDGWIPKVTGYKSGENPLNGFRVENGILKIDYSKYAAFNGRFSHLFYKEKLSSYMLHVEYRFLGEVLPDAPSYCYRNSGVMVHSQSPESMEVIQNWPVSIEVQLLGSTDKRKQLTANVCTPGTTVNYKGILSNQHCINSTSRYYYDGEWVNLDIIVHGGKDIYHVIDGDTVLTYSKPQIGGNLLTDNYPVPEGNVLADGYIALQGEGQPIEFRRVDLKYLDDRKLPVKGGKERNFDKIEKATAENTSKAQTGSILKVIDDFDSYTGNDQLSKAWSHPGRGGAMKSSLESVIKGSGKYSLKCEFTNTRSEDTFYSSVCHPDKWDLSGCNGVRFWFKPDGSGREMTFELNIADKEGKNIHDLWDYVYKTEKGDTAARIVTVPFYALVHNIRYADSPDVSPKFKPEAVIEVAIYIGGRNDEPGSGIFYFDEIAGCKLQF